MLILSYSRIVSYFESNLRTWAASFWQAVNRRSLAHRNVQALISSVFLELGLQHVASGRFGEVFSAIYRNGDHVGEVAVKVLKDEESWHSEHVRPSLICHFHVKLNTFKVKLDNFQTNFYSFKIKLGTLPDKLDGFEIDLYILKIKTSFFHAFFKIFLA